MGRGCWIRGSWRGWKNHEVAQPLDAINKASAREKSGWQPTVNARLTLLYWKIDMRIRKDILKEKRAEYGEEIVSALLRQLRWTHFLSIIYLDDPLKRDFYMEAQP